MGGFGSCGWPIWRTDDFTTCFQSIYLKTVFPLIVVCLSFVHLVLQSVCRHVKTKRASAYEQVPNHHHHTELPREEDGFLDIEADEEELTINGGGRLALVKTTTKGSIVQADTPSGQQLSVIVEELTIVGLVALNVVALVTGTYGGHGQLTAIVGTVTWLYVLVLATLRLFLEHTKWRVPQLWSHTATIYGCQWLFSIFIFRSVLIHPSSQLAQTLVIADFCLTTVLFTMAMTTRKGNKTVILEWEGDIEPTREPLASVFSLLTFSWVESMLWKGYKEPLEIGTVWNLLPRDKAAAVLADYRQVKKTTTLAWHLAMYFKTMLIIQAIWALVAGVLTFAPTLLLKAILEYVEAPDATPRNVLWLFVILLPVTDVIRSVADGQGLWIGRKISIRIRAIIIGEIYAKALRRKAASGKEMTKKAETPKETKWDKVKKMVGLKKKPNTDNQSSESNGDAAKADPTKDVDDQANLGTIINLMSVDSFKISEVTAYLHFLFAAAPSQLIVCIALLYQVMGLSAVPGLVVIVFLLPINIILAKGFHRTQKRIMAATDKRINTTNEVLQNIRIIKYFAWEQRFSTIVDEKRAAELKALRSRYMIWAVAVAIWNTVPVLISFFSFLVYTKIEGKPLYPSIAFTAISLFLLLRVPLDQLGDMIAHVQEAKVSIDRVEEFLEEEETEKYKQLGPDNVDENGNKLIGFRHATFIWGNKETVAADGSMAFRLLDLTTDFNIGKLNIIAGPTGSGKSSLLMALLGEMTMVKGKVYLPGSRSREDVRVDPETGLAETCAYVAQGAWLINGDIRENILFAAPYDEKRYRDVIVACALERDLDILDDGDETVVGEKGITLSGGQKQRISLARAVYSNSRHLLLDDCLSAVDSHTAQWIFNNCIKGPLMKDRTCIMVTHNVSLCVPSSEYVVLLENGRVATQGPSLEVMASGALGEDLRNKSRPSSAHVSRVPSRVPSSVGEESGETLIDDGGNNATNGHFGKKDKKKRAMDEAKAVGSVKWSVLKLYLSAMGQWWFWVITVFVFTAQQLSGVASNVWIRQWANQYTTSAEYITKTEFSALSQNSMSTSVSPAYFASILNHAKDRATFSPAQHAPGAAQEVDVDYYLTVLALIGIAGAIFALFRDLWLFFGSLTASWKLHNQLMASVARAKFKFFDVTPLGQLMNRFSKDLEAVDQEVAPVAIGVMTCALGVIVTVILIAAITPGFLIAGVFITIMYIFVGMFYLRASRDLKRLESVNRSPLFQQFGETLSGVTTIRAYGDERRFIRENLAKVNTQARPFIYLWAANRWLAFRTDLLGDFVAFFAGVFVILSIGKINAGDAGISLSYAISFSDNILWLVRLYAMNEQNMNSVERVKEYLDVEQEAEPINEKNRPPKNWPAQGTVEFIGYSTSYRADLEPVLRNVTFKIKPFEKVGIVGRTGAGKSSLTLAIFRALEANTGKILIDDIDIGMIGLRDLREAMTMVPQDPTLFTGTIRTNLDPFNLYTDEEVFNALRRVHLIGPDETPATPVTPTATRLLLPDSPSKPTEGDEQLSTGTSTPTANNKNIFLDLSSPVAESGSNLSQGQRQLLCLARAMLKSPKVLIMDEATASIDYATDSKIQDTIREINGTIITIAHRLATIVDYDKVLVLDHGAVVEYAHPWELLKNEKGSFRSMCETSGDLDSLLKAAKKAYEAKRLVDDE
ncbi:ABC transporter type 1, transmembrane domain-containing protein [Pseudomassariella vexata]|uniref:ABC transporter type 1, transmembrane domain-containing protein n=1 Tax=Pseudomassariella vexata TaxID=1141098 RepID=A0A1Y2EMJ4_9PEZI|nr:ABC transporter type 1, transmembrane domain-containing protein [Pseudomassariella vexata]ORY72055.1 ABC transporter type 1, transmembrane domain-containing protein [Pseudomassariella vexata]